MKKYFLAVFLFLQIGFLYAQNEKTLSELSGLKENKTQKSPFKEWEFGMQGNILISNRIYMECYLTEDISFKTSISASFFGAYLQGEIRFYKKVTKNWRFYFSAGGTVNPIWGWVNGFGLIALRYQIKKDFHFAMGIGVEGYHFPLAEDYSPGDDPLFILPRYIFPWPAITLRFGFNTF